MPGRWFDASQNAECWDGERLQAGCLREIVVYDDDGADQGAAFVRVTQKGKSNQHGALCSVEFLGATDKDYHWYANPANAGAPGAITKKEVVHFCRCSAQKCKRSGKARGPRGYGVQPASIHREVSEEDLLALRSGVLYPGVADKF